MPAVMPSAKVVNETVRLFVMMALEASGFTVTSDCVHIWRLAIVSIMSLPSRYCWKRGSATAIIIPAAARTKKIAKAANVYGRVSWNISGKRLAIEA